jgi:hypothetical protein
MIQENPLSGALKSWTYEQFVLTEPRSHGWAGTVLLTDETPNRCVRRVLAMNITTLLTYRLARAVKALTLGRQKTAAGITIPSCVLPRDQNGGRSSSSMLETALRERAAAE